MTTFFLLREVDKVGLISMNIVTHIIQIYDCKTNVYCMVPEKPADVISEVVNFPSFMRIIGCFTASASFLLRRGTEVYNIIQYM